MEKVVSVNDLFFGYDDKFILKDINLNIFKGDYLGVVGPNGAAKSTLIKLILGILQPQKGTIKIFNKNIKKFKEWEKVGYVAQKASFFNSSFPATVEEIVSANLFSQIGIFKPIKKIHMDNVYKVLKIVGMENYGKKLIGNLSGGQQQKIFIARSLVNEPEIIFLDEPTVGIDLKSQLEFYDLMEKLNSDMKITIVMVSHDIGVITEKVSRIACMGNQKLYTHNKSCKVPFNEFISKVYGDKMSLLIHNH